MPGIWSNDGSGWRLLSTSGFPDEARLHSLIEEAPQLLPLAGSPQLVIVGREVQLGGGYADRLAVEPSGRPAIIEVKLARNAEARRAIVSQQASSLDVSADVSPPGFGAGRWRVSMISDAMTSVLDCARRE